MILIKGPNGQYFSIQNGKAVLAEHSNYKIGQSAASFDMSREAEDSAQLFPI